jgi:NADH-quinone oxidoreductase subunit H
MMIFSLLQTAAQTAPMVHVSPPPSGMAWFLSTVVKMLLTFTIYMVGVMYVIWLERRVCAWMQDRLGPNRVGYQGLLQSVADGVKNIMKEETYPGEAYLPLFILAPVMSFIPALLTWAVIPYGAAWASPWGTIDMALAPMPIGFLFILAISSLGVYGIVLAGWASNNKYSLLGGLRSSAQMISYEIAMGMSTIPVLILAGNVSLSKIVEQQASAGGGLHWNVINLTVAFFVFIIAAFAETNRNPFDLPEAESELIAGYHSEYSAMKFSMFFIAEYANIMTASALMATLFFGGWDIPFTQWDNAAPHTLIKTLLTFGVFWLKVLVFVFVFIWVRWTLPRFRYDQLMALGWKLMLALAYIVVVAGVALGLQYAGIYPDSWKFAVTMLVVNIVLMGLIVFVLDRGRLISPAYSRLERRDLDKLRQARYNRARFEPVLTEGGAD